VRRAAERTRASVVCGLVPIEYLTHDNPQDSRDTHDFLTAESTYAAQILDLVAGKCAYEKEHACDLGKKQFIERQDSPPPTGTSP
jgi:hypothetical protein